MIIEPRASNRVFIYLEDGVTYLDMFTMAGDIEDGVLIQVKRKTKGIRTDGDKIIKSVSI